MISGTQPQLSTQSFLQPRPKLRREPRISIRHNTRRDTMQTYDLLNIQFCQPFHRIIHSYRSKVSRLHQPINNNPNRITILRCPRQTRHKIHRNSIPFPIRNKQRFHQSRRFLMFNFRLLTNQTSINKLSNFLFHSRPPKQLFQVMIHLSSIGMNTQSTTMSFFQNTFPKFCNIRNTHSVTKSDNTILVNSEFTSLTLVNQCQLIHHNSIRFLSSSNFLKNTTSQFQHSQLNTIRSSLAYQTQVSELLNQFQFTNHQHRHMQGLPTQCICNNVCLTRMVIQTKIILLQEFQPSPLPHIQLFLMERYFKLL